MADEQKIDTPFETWRSNLFSGSALERSTMDGSQAYPADEAAIDLSTATDHPATPNTDKPTTREWRTAMANIKPVEDASQDFTADLAALRDDVAKLSASVSEFIRSQTAATTNSVADAVGNARQKISDSASKAQDRVASASSELEATIERNPLSAVLIAMVMGLLVGLLSRGRK